MQHVYRPKRYGEDIRHVHKRRKLDGEGRWEVKDGFDKYGVHDQDYETMLEGLTGLKL